MDDGAEHGDNAEFEEEAGQSPQGDEFDEAHRLVDMFWAMEDRHEYGAPVRVRPPREPPGPVGRIAGPAADAPGGEIAGPEEIAPVVAEEAAVEPPPAAPAPPPLPPPPPAADPPR